MSHKIKQTYNFHEINLRLIPRKSKESLRLIDNVLNSEHIHTKLSFD